MTLPWLKIRRMKAATNQRRQTVATEKFLSFLFLLVSDQGVRNPISLSWMVLAAASTRAIAAPPDVVPEPKLSAHSTLDQLGFKFEATKKTEDIPSIFTGPPPVVEMEASLPNYEVIAPKLKLKSNDVATDKLRVEQAVNKYTSPLYRATFGPASQVAEYYFNFLSILHGWHPNEPEAMALREQDIELERMDEIKTLSRLDAIGNPDAVKVDLKTERDVYFQNH